ncbi:hypothetical protein AX769_01790 [Frondihabitans sp. PAMC 28766]|uniref:CPBP family intramembrane glutamic endopeptidase n=1 Tax=Frondihabitans sp. PAMC 28766 TaxID=1795630 RepID=UPI00078CE4E4|nr:type II CAAX endopeptidase family protein [Frondihabitans sp. PAMC 28766]AMM19096.1 hypothetical protein AX769_01790 [Frondihabitans sp. PAMC 28766]
MRYAYHRLFRILPTYRWWKPIVAAVVAFVLYTVFSFVWQEIVLLVVQSDGGDHARTALLTAWEHDQQNASNPLVMLFTLGSLATMLPAVILAVRILRLGPLGQLTSVVGRLRWRWMLLCLVPSAVYMAIDIGLNQVVPLSWQGADAASSGTGQATPAGALAVSIVLIVILVPVQAAGEEFAFRGLGMQTFGSWFPWPVVAIVVPTVGFAFAHSYNVWGKIDVAALGIAFGYLTWRTGGLEAGLAAHVVNNVVVFVLAAPIVTNTQSNGSPAGAAVSVISSAAYVGMVSWLARKKRPERTAPGPLVPAPLTGGRQDPTIR